MIGIDIFEIERVTGLIAKKNFFQRMFTPSEIEYIKKRNNSHFTIAGLIACKEAVAKAFGTGISKDLAFKDIEILHEKSGRPIINLDNERIKILMDKLGVDMVNISISHDGAYAIAIADLR